MSYIRASKTSLYIVKNETGRQLSMHSSSLLLSIGTTIVFFHSDKKIPRTSRDLKIISMSRHIDLTFWTRECSSYHDCVSYLNQVYWLFVWCHLIEENTWKMFFVSKSECKVNLFLLLSSENYFTKNIENFAFFFEVNYKYIFLKHLCNLGNFFCSQQTF